LAGKSDAANDIHRGAPMGMSRLRRGTGARIRSGDARDLTVANVDTGYHGRQVVYAASLHVDAGEVVAVLGHNGAGKTTLLRTICGASPIWTGSVAVGSIKLPAARASIALVPQGRGVFSGLTVRENLLLGAWRQKNEQSLERALKQFPALRERLGDDGGVLSGGQRQMVSIGRALLTAPAVMLLDEPSVGLAPRLVDEVLSAVRGLAREWNMAIVLVEQNIRQALAVSDRVYVMRSGRIVASGASDEFESQSELWHLT
jgi:branched-chain amino acid transport system ATP-binding protein